MTLKSALEKQDRDTMPSKYHIAIHDGTGWNKFFRMHVERRASPR